MTDQNQTTTTQKLNIGQMVQAEVINLNPTPVTTSGVPSVRTVATSLTTGNVSIRYVPRPTQPAGNLDTTN